MEWEARGVMGRRRRMCIGERTAGQVPIDQRLRRHNIASSYIRERATENATEITSATATQQSAAVAAAGPMRSPVGVEHASDVAVPLEAQAD